MIVRGKERRRTTSGRWLRNEPVRWRVQRGTKRSRRHLPATAVTNLSSCRLRRSPCCVVSSRVAASFRFRCVVVFVGSWTTKDDGERRPNVLCVDRRRQKDVLYTTHSIRSVCRSVLGCTASQHLIFLLWLLLLSPHVQLMNRFLSRRRNLEPNAAHIHSVSSSPFIPAQLCEKMLIKCETIYTGVWTTVFLTFLTRSISCCHLVRKNYVDNCRIRHADISALYNTFLFIKNLIKQSMRTKTKSTLNDEKYARLLLS